MNKIKKTIILSSLLALVGCVEKINNKDDSLSVSYTCPGGDADNTVYNLSLPISGISMAQSGTGSNCRLKFTCPAGYHVATGAQSLPAGSAWQGSQLETADPSYNWNNLDNQTSLLAAYASGDSEPDTDSTYQGAFIPTDFFYKNAAFDTTSIYCFANQ